MPLAHLVNFTEKETQAVVICPTRELCLQISRDIEAYTKFIPGARTTAVYGGASIETQWKQLKRVPHIIIATPGRLKDFLGKKAIDLSSVQYVVLDEADEMLNMGFKEDIDDILEYTPTSKKTWLFSATMPREVAAIAKNFMTDPVEVTVGHKNQSAVTITHQYALVKDRDRYPGLKRFLDVNPSIFGIIFCNTRHHTREVAEELMKDGYNADALHGDLSQAQRDSVMNKFRSRTLQILVATDVAARGIDVDNVTHVIHYMLPDDVENYTHRSGRTGRAGKEGTSIAMCSNRDMGKVSQIERIIKQKLIHTPVPNGDEICQLQLLSFIKKVIDTKVDDRKIEEFIPAIEEALAGMTAEDVIKKFISVELNRFLDYYKHAGDINDNPRNRGDRAEREGSYGPSNDNFSRFFINIGKMDDLDKGGLLRFICDNTNIPGADVGRIELKSQYSFFEVETKSTEGLIEALSGTDWMGRSVRAEASEKTGGGGSSRGGGERRGGGGGPRGSYGRGGEAKPRRRFTPGGEGGGSSRPPRGESRRPRNKEGFRHK